MIMLLRVLNENGPVDEFIPSECLLGYMRIIFWFSKYGRPEGILTLVFPNEARGQEYLRPITALAKLKNEVERVWIKEKPTDTRL